MTSMFSPIQFTCSTTRSLMLFSSANKSSSCKTSCMCVIFTRNTIKRNAVYIPRYFRLQFIYNMLNDTENIASNNRICSYDVGIDSYAISYMLQRKWVKEGCSVISEVKGQRISQVYNVRCFTANN